MDSTSTSRSSRNEEETLAVLHVQYVVGDKYHSVNIRDYESCHFSVTMCTQGHSTAVRTWVPAV